MTTRATLHAEMIHFLRTVSSPDLDGLTSIAHRLDKQHRHSSSELPEVLRDAAGNSIGFPPREFLGIRRVVAAHGMPQDAIERVFVRFVAIIQIEFERLLSPVESFALQ